MCDDSGALAVRRGWVSWRSLYVSLCCVECLNPAAHVFNLPKACAREVLLSRRAPLFYTENPYGQQQITVQIAE
jgi:hypothetical protein